MAAEREIKTVLTLDDASFSRGLKAATSNVAAIRAEMNASIKKADGLGKGFKKWSASVSGLNKVLKAERQQMKVLNKEYQTQKKALAEAVKEMEKARKEHGEDSEEVKKASNAYAALAAKVNELRKQMALLEQQEEDDEEQLKENVEKPFKKVGQALGAVALGFTTLAISAGAALISLSGQAQQSANELKQNLAANETEFGIWSKFLQQEADKAWENLGLSKSAYLAAANDIGAFLQEAGAPVQQSAEISAQVLEMAASLSSEYGVPIEQVLSDIKEAANGSRTAMNRYGIAVTGTTVQQTALKYGVTKTYKEMTEEEQKLWAVKTALEQGAEAQKTYTTETNNTTQASSTLTAAWENFLSGAGSAEDVGKAAGNLVSAWAEKIVTEGPTMVRSAIKMAGQFLNAFLMSFSSTWSFKIWPEIQKYFKATFKVDLPDWNTVTDTIQSWWDTNIKPIIDFVANYSVAAGQTIKEAVGVVSGWWSGVSEWIAENETLQAVFSVIGETWRNAVATVRAWWADVSTKIQEQGILKTLFHAVGDTWANVSSVVSSWWDNDVAPQIERNGLFTTLFHVAGDVWENVSETVSSWWNEKIDPKIQENGGLLQTVFHVIGDVWDNVSKTVSSWWDKDISPKIQNNKLLQTIFTAVGQDWENLKSGIDKWWNGENGVGAKIAEDGLFKTIFGVDPPTWSDVWQAIRTSWNGVKNLFDGIVSTVFGIKIPSWDEIATEWNTFWSNAYDNLPGWLQDILNFFGLGGSSTVTASSTVLTNATEKLADEVNSAASSIQQLGSAAAVATASINSQGQLEELGIHSNDDLINFLRYGTVGGSHAGGAWNVPFNNYVARLHAGEMVLTADQARRYRAAAASGGNTYNDSASIYIDKYNQYSGADADALLQQMQMMQRRQRMGYGLA